MISFSKLGSFGRLGNQMFQYSCAYAAAKRNNTHVSISTHDAYRESSVNQLVQTFELKSAIFDRYDGITNLFQESGFSYDSRIENVPNNTELRGYFQSEIYFRHMRNELLQSELVFKPEILLMAKKFIDDLGSPGPICSIHIRRGDYKSLSDTHTNLGHDYYSEALSLIPNCEKYLVFSDEPNEARLMLERIASSTSSKFLYPSLDYASSLCVMSMCNHHIIANSSFSWWGAWLSSDNTVVAPSKWFGTNGPQNWNDVYCHNWKRV